MSGSSQHVRGGDEPPLELEHTPCDLCGADDAAPLFVASDVRYGIAGEFPVVRCRRCELVERCGHRIEEKLRIEPDPEDEHRQRQERGDFMQ